MSSYTMDHKYGRCTSQREQQGSSNCNSLGVFRRRRRQHHILDLNTIKLRSPIFVGHFLDFIENKL